MKMSGDLPGVAQTGARVVHAFAFSVHAAIAFCTGFFGGTALVGDLFDAFLWGGFVVGGWGVSFGFGRGTAGCCQQGQSQANGDQGSKPVFLGQGWCGHDWASEWLCWCDVRMLPREPLPSSAKNPVSIRGCRATSRGA